MDNASDNLNVDLTEKELEELLASLPDFIRDLEKGVA